MRTTYVHDGAVEDVTKELVVGSSVKVVVRGYDNSIRRRIAIWFNREEAEGLVEGLKKVLEEKE